MTISVNSGRLWARLMEMAQIGATEKGGCNRQALTDADISGRDLFAGWCRAAGCQVRIDRIGNLFARRPGRLADAPPVLTGSHLDTQPTGGKFDGVYGVLAGLEVIETLNDHGLVTDHPIELAVWCNEEGCRFTTAMMGSAVWSGNMPIADAEALVDDRGVSVAQELARTGQAGSQEATHFPLKAAFEAHIEQGPVLEREDRTIGIIEGVQNMSRHEVVIEGREAHAGPTPMAMRKDPIRALSVFLPRLYALCADHGPDARLTIGVIQAEPGSSNTVPGRLMLTLDIRHPDLEVYEALVDSACSTIREACARENAPVAIREFFHAPGVVFDEACVGSVEAAARAFGYPAMRMTSGAGHDSCNLASVAPTAMIFIPCAGGISHNEAESIEPEHAAAGANVLLHAMLEQSGMHNKV